MPALLLRLLLQCAGDIKMNHGPVSTPTPTYCLRLMQWNANRISGNITELLTFIHSNNATIQETKLTNKGGGLLMPIKETIPFINTAAALPHQQLQIHNIHIPPRSSCSAGHNASIAHLLCNNEMSLIVGDINAHHSRWDTNTNEEERGEQLEDKIDAADNTILNENEATQQPTNGRSTSPDIGLASNDIARLSN